MSYIPGYYQRGTGTQYGSPEKLQALADGYFGLNMAFLINVLLVIMARVGTAVMPDPGTGVGALLGAILIIGVVVAVVSFPPNKKIAIGKGWPVANAALASFLMALNSILCCGIIGYVVMQQIASGEMKKYGLRAGFFGLKKRDVQAKIAEMRSSEFTPPKDTPPPPAYMP